VIVCVVTRVYSVMVLCDLAVGGGLRIDAEGGVQVVFNNGDKCGGSGPARQVTFQVTIRSRHVLTFCIASDIGLVVCRMCGVDRLSGVW
jgi:hypothetical protein